MEANNPVINCNDVTKEFYKSINAGYQAQYQKFIKNKQIEQVRQELYLVKINELTTKYKNIINKKINITAREGRFSITFYDCFLRDDFEEWDDILPANSPSYEYSSSKCAQRLIEDMIYNEYLPCIIRSNVEKFDDNKYLRITMRWV
jgi:hypothetical protein